MRNRRLLKPTRSWMKKTGPGESSLIAIAAATNIGVATSSMITDTERSISRLASVRQLNGGTLPNVTIGMPSKSSERARASFCGNMSDIT